MMIDVKRRGGDWSCTGGSDRRTGWEAELRRPKSTFLLGRDGTFLALIYGWFTEGFDTTDLKEAKALLDELS